jgi:hypothetical protein
MIRPVPHIDALQALAALQPAGSLVLGADTDRVVSVDASNMIGRFKNLQGKFLPHFENCTQWLMIMSYRHQYC